MKGFSNGDFIINYNSDMSGNIEIINLETDESVSIPGIFILDFVAEYIRNEKISKLQNMNNNDLLKEIINT